MQKKMSLEEFTQHCNNINSCYCCVYRPKNKQDCYKIYDDVKRKRAIIETNSIYGIIRKEF